MAATDTPAATAFWGATADLAAISALADPAAAARLADGVRRVAERSVVVATTDRAEQLERVDILLRRGESDPKVLRWVYVNEFRDGRPSWFANGDVAHEVRKIALDRDGLPMPTQSALLSAKQAAARACVRRNTNHGRGLAAVGDDVSDDVAAVAAAETAARQNTARENRLAQSHGRRHGRVYGLKLAPLSCCTGSGDALEARSIAVGRRLVWGWWGGIMKPLIDCHTRGVPAS